MDKDEEYRIIDDDYIKQKKKSEEEAVKKNKKRKKDEVYKIIEDAEDVKRRNLKNFFVAIEQEKQIEKKHGPIYHEIYNVGFIMNEEEKEERLYFHELNDKEEEKVGFYYTPNEDKLFEYPDFLDVFNTFLSVSSKVKPRENLFNLYRFLKMENSLTKNGDIPNIDLIFRMNSKKTVSVFVDLKLGFNILESEVPLAKVDRASKTIVEANNKQTREFDLQ